MLCFLQLAQEAQQEQPRQEVIALLLSSTELYHQVLIALDKLSDPDRERRVEYINNQGRTLSHAAREAKKEQPRQEVVGLLLNSAELHRQALIALDKLGDSHNKQQARYLNNQGLALFHAAQEAQKEQPRQELIDRLLSSAELYRQALMTLDNLSDPDNKHRERYFSNQGLALFHAAQEAQKEQPRQELIDRLLSSAELYRQALIALETLNDPDRKKRARYFNNQGVALFDM